jgi:hypothetical protein
MTIAALNRIKQAQDEIERLRILALGAYNALDILSRAGNHRVTITSLRKVRRFALDHARELAQALEGSIHDRNN